jgi:hypothetical protein
MADGDEKYYGYRRMMAWGLRIYAVPADAFMRVEDGCVLEVESAARVDGVVRLDGVLRVKLRVWGEGI